MRLLRVKFVRHWALPYFPPSPPVRNTAISGWVASMSAASGKQHASTNPMTSASALPASIRYSLSYHRTVGTGGEEEREAKQASQLAMIS